MAMLAPEVLGFDLSGFPAALSGLFWPGNRGSAGSGKIGISDAKIAENSALGVFHLEGVLGLFVIVADQMQETVHGKMGEMMGERLALRAGFARDGLEGENDVAKMLGRRSGRHILGRE
jgi:hypothetical protein